MRNVVLFMFATLDGLIAGPDGGLDAVTPANEEHQYTNDLIRSASAMMFGRRIYEIVAGFWDTVDISAPTLSPIEVEFATIFRATPRVVFSRTLTDVDPKAMLIKSDIARQVSKLKDQPGGPLLLGCGPELLATLANLDLIDEYRVILNPTLLGSGKPLFNRIDQRVKLKLLETKVFPSGGVLLSYETVRPAAARIVADAPSAPQSEEAMR